MASFTDIIPQFNPYVQQLPVEAMVKVGMAKQQMYEQNVTKIQAEIDRIAGLDVVRDVDKKHLQSKLNQLHGKLSILSGGDFSNFQLANSVGGMTKQIAKDKYVRNAVSSTNFYRKQQEIIEKAKKEGKANPSNLYNFNRKANAYLLSTELDKSFNDSYIEYYDVDKHVKDAFKDLQKDGYTVEQIFQMNEDGSFAKDPNGKLIYNPVMTRLEREGIFPEKVRAVLNQVMNDPRVNQQLQLDGEYNYRVYDSASLKERLVKSRDGIVAGLRAKIGEANIKKGAGQDIGTTIEDLEKLIENVTSRYDSSLSLADKNPDAIRGMLYKDEVKDNWTGTYTSIIEKKTTHENPAWNQMFKQQQEINRVREAEEQKRIGWANVQIARDRLKLDREEMVLNFRMKEMENNAKANKGGKPTLDFIDSKVSFVQQEIEELSLAATNLANSSDNLLYQAYFGANAKKWVDDQVANKKMSRDKAIQSVIAQMAKSSGKDVDTYRTEALFKIKDWWNAPTAKVSKDDRNALNSAITASKMWTDLNAKKKATDARVADEARKQGLKYADPSEYIKTLGSKEKTLLDGKKITLSPQDMYDIALSNIDYRSIYSWGSFATEEFKQAVIAANKRLASKGLSSLSKMKYPGYFTNLGIVETDSAGKTIGQIQNKLANGGLFSAVQLRGKVLQETGNFAPNLKKSVLTGDSETDKATRAEVSAMFTSYLNNKQNESPEFVNNAAKIGKAIQEGSISIHTSKNNVTGEVKPTLRFVDKDGNYAGEMRISSDEAASIGQNISMFYEPQRISNARDRLSVFQNGTTSMTGDVKDFQTYRLGDVLLSEEDFPLIRNTPVKANIKEQVEYTSEGPITRYYGYLYTVKDGKERIHVTPPSESLEKAVGAMQQIDQAMLQSIK